MGIHRVCLCVCLCVCVTHTQAWATPEPADVLGRPRGPAGPDGIVLVYTQIHRVKLWDALGRAWYGTHCVRIHNAWTSGTGVRDHAGPPRPGLHTHCVCVCVVI